MLGAGPHGASSAMRFGVVPFATRGILVTGGCRCYTSAISTSYSRVKGVDARVSGFVEECPSTESS